MFKCSGRSSKYLEYWNISPEPIISTLLPEQKMHELDFFLWLPNILPKTCPKISGKVRGKKIGSPYYIPNPNDKLSFVNKRWETNLIIFSNINLLKKDANLHSLSYFSFWCCVLVWVFRDFLHKKYLCWVFQLNCCLAKYARVSGLNQLLITMKNIVHFSNTVGSLLHFRSMAALLCVLGDVTFQHLSEWFSWWGFLFLFGRTSVATQQHSSLLLLCRIWYVTSRRTHLCANRSWLYACFVLDAEKTLWCCNSI